MTGCRPTPSHAVGVTTTPVRKHDRRRGLGRGFRITGTNTWEYGAVENPTDKLYTPPGGDIGAWHTTGSYARMLSDMSRDAYYPGHSTHPYSRYRCIGSSPSSSSSMSDVGAARAVVGKVETRGFTPAPKLYIPKVWVETLVLWSDKALRPQRGSGEARCPRPESSGTGAPYKQAR